MFDRVYFISCCVVVYDKKVCIIHYGYIMYMYERLLDVILIFVTMYE